MDDKLVSKAFASLMMKSKVRSAMRWLSERAIGGVLDPMQEVKKSVTVLEILKSKHPEPHKSHLSSRLQVPVLPDFEDVIISSTSIEKTTGTFRGSSGASGTDLADAFITSWGSQFTLERQSCNSRNKNVQSNLTMVKSSSTGFWKIDCA